MDGSGNFLVAYETRAYNSSPDIYARYFASDGTPQGDEFAVHTNVDWQQQTPDVAMNATGNAVVVWRSGDTYPTSIRGRRYDGGIAVGSGFTATASVETGAAAPAVAVDAGGDFTVVWEQSGDSYQTSTGVRAQRYYSTAVPDGVAFWVNTTNLGWQQEADIAMAPTGEFVVVWNGSLSGYETNIYAQYFLSDGIPSGPEFRTNERFDDLQRRPSVATDHSGRFAVAWQSGTGGLLPASYGIFGRIFDGLPLTNSPPVPTDDTYTIDEDTGISVSPPGVLSNDLDPEADPLSAINITQLQRVGESFSFNTDGSFTYTPTVDFNGTREFTYVAGDPTLDSSEATVTITVSPVSDPPVARDDAFTIDEDTARELWPLYNDYDPDGLYDPDSSEDLDPTTLTVVTDTAHGTLTNNGDGTVYYAPDASYNGSDSFVYEICDGTSRCDSAIADITLLPVNDPPVATDDAYGVDEDNPLSVPTPGVLDNDDDVDGDVLTVTVESDVEHGSLLLDAYGALTYTSDANYHGLDHFTYTAGDGVLASNVATVTIDIAPVNDPPVIAGLPDQSLDEDTSLDNAIDLWAYASDVETADTNLSFSIDNSPEANAGITTDAGHYIDINPAANWYGATDVRILVQDPVGASVTDTFQVTVNPVNDPPRIDPSVPDQSADEDTPISIDLTPHENDVDSSGTDLDWYVTGADSAP
jgi:VCBS repeat-containing protein